MFVKKIEFTPVVERNFHNFKHEKNNENSKNNYSNESIKFAYRDYNISFGTRLFRSPENFYEQDFNKNNMPLLMKNYLYADYPARRSMPPAHLMKVVYEDINDIESLEFVKRVFSKTDNYEPLFANLTDTPKRNARKGVVSEVEAMKDEFKNVPLFKDGNSNFGLYLLRKIYFEGKTLNEINKDFKKDLSKVYEGLIESDIKYDDVYAYGIKFPRQSFWNSFTATREDFPYVYKPRKLVNVNTDMQKKDRTLSDIMSGKSQSVPSHKPQRFKIKNDAEGKRIGDAIISSVGGRHSLENGLRHRAGIRDNEELSFVSKYFSQIMSVSLERMHASEVMKDFFSNYDNLNKKQREKFNAYWRSNPKMRELQSLAISDTIKLFFENYGADGNNSEFQELLNYADSIKPLRDAKIAEHNRIQSEYDELARILSEEDIAKNKSDSLKSDVGEVKKLSEDELQRILEEKAIKNGAKVYTFDTKEGVYRIVLNIDEEFDKVFRKQFSLLPKPLVSKFLNFSKKSPLASEEYFKTVALVPSVPDNVREILMPSVRKCQEVSDNINRSFDLKYGQALLSGEQALAEMLIRKSGIQNVSLLLSRAVDLCNFASDKLNISAWSEEERNMIEQAYASYIQPMKDFREAKNIRKAFIEYLSAISPDSKDWIPVGHLDEIHSLIAANLRMYPKFKDELSDLLIKIGFIEKYGGSSRILLKDDVPELVKNTKAKLIFEDLLYRYPHSTIPFLTFEPNNILNYVKSEGLKSSLLSRFAASFIK